MVRWGFEFLCLFVCNRGDIAVTAGSEHGSLANPLWEPVLDVFPYTIARAAMRDTAVGIWSALETGKPGSAPPRVGPQGQARRHFDHWVSADPTGAPAILQVDSRPQAILKFRQPSSLVYRLRHEVLPDFFSISKRSRKKGFYTPLNIRI